MVDPLSGGYGQFQYAGYYGISQPADASGADVPRHARPVNEGIVGGRKADGVQKSECETCNNRKYQDVSNDPGVSFKSPTHISPAAAEGLVRAHEGEHVANAQAEAGSKGGRAISTVSIHYSTCPECGRAYVSGGTTRSTLITPDGDDSPPSEKQDKQRSSIDVYA